jgi:3-phenylpropionate/trans-cinnamate dioxygenase ferredoxin reductase subunit
MPSSWVAAPRPVPRRAPSQPQGGTSFFLTAEDRSPYDRTVLSKDVLLLPGAAVPEVWPAGDPWRERIEVRTNTTVASLDPDARRLVTASGDVVTFESVILATGAQPRRLALPGADGEGVHYLRDTTDAAALSQALDHASRVVIVGGGVIGLEVAAAAATRGVDVVVLEAADRVLARGVPAAVAGWLCALHEAARGGRAHGCGAGCRAALAGRCRHRCPAGRRNRRAGRRGGGRHRHRPA